MGITSRGNLHLTEEHLHDVGSGRSELTSTIGHIPPGRFLHYIFRVAR